MILVHSDHQKFGIGSLLVNEMKKDERSVSAWITPRNNYFRADSSIYKTPLHFYLKNGFRLTDETFENDDFYSKQKIVYWRVPLADDLNRSRLEKKSTNLFNLGFV